MPIPDSEDATDLLARAIAAVERDPTDAEAWNMLGGVRIQRGELAQSRDCFARAAEIDPGFVKALNNLAVTLQQLGDLEAAAMRYRQVLELAPGHQDIQFNYAALLGALGRHAEGLARADHLVGLAPDMIKAHLLAADFERDLGRSPEALARLERALALAPDQVEALTRRAHIRRQLGQWRLALSDCDHALTLAPGAADALHLRAQALQGLDRPIEALEAFATAEAVSPAPARIITSRAILLGELGRRDEALAALEQALVLQPDLADAWYSRANLTRYAPGDSDLAAMEMLADRPDASPHDRIHLSFALGKAYLDLGDGERAFARLDQGARLKRASLGYDPQVDAGLIDEIAAIFSAERLGRLGGSGDPSTRPIFVVGMPRSGTTLVEQILASHPQVHGAGEATHLADMAEAPGFLAAAPGLAPEDFADLGRRYLDLVGATASEAQRIVDKLPSNFLHLGLISLTLPGARVIHCRRDPLDTCLSCYSLLFTRGHEYAYDLDELGRFYGLYRRLMAHWRQILPPGTMLDFDYEVLIREPEAQIRKLLSFCGLPWDEACLRFYETPRRVTSASLDQVRSPLYSSSIGRAQRFRPWLGPLDAALARAGVS
ncbi:MAG TPA: sulfotransferase [Caulobacteraceae bacterium]|jgi:tetratricopeptide (TPR) repeat protein